MWYDTNILKDHSGWRWNPTTSLHNVTTQTTM